MLVESDGAEVVFPPGFTNRDGQPLPLIVRKGDGGFDYATTDLATVIDRVERVKATLLLYVVGAPQAQHLQMVFAVAEEVGWLQPPARAVHVAFGNVLGTDHKMLRSRSGQTVKLIELLDEAVERAERAVAEKNPDLAPDERAAVARAVGIGAVKYADLSTDRIKDYVFDWDRMLAFDGNTAPYLQYAHARIRSIFRRAGVDRASVQARHPDPRGAGGAGAGPRHPRVRGGGAGDARALGAPPALHLPVRARQHLHGVLRGLPGAALRGAAAHQPAGAGRPHGPRAGLRARPARHRGAGADVSPATTGLRLETAARLG